MINCAKCGKENQDHYKFCLGCGAELAKSAAPKPFNPNTPPHGNPAVRPSSIPRPGGASAAPAGGSATGSAAVGSAAVGSAAVGSAAVGSAAVGSAAVGSAAGGSAPKATASAPVAEPAAAAEPVAAPAQAAAPAADGGVSLVECPQCGHRNKPGNRFCASCGFNVAAASTPPQQGKSAANVPAANVGGAAPAVTVTLTALRADGTEAGSFALPSAPVTLLGRDTGSIFAGDSYLSPRHASILISGTSVTVRDEGSLNGVYLRLRPQSPWQLKFGDMFRIGQEIIKLEALDGQTPGPDGVVRLGSPREGYVGRLALVIGRDTTGNAFPIPRGGVHCGRERGDILFSDDGYVSGLHCRIAPEDNGQIYLTDVGSSNGTFVRLSRDHALAQSDILLMGQQLFRVDLR